jgi:hypothetical protein
MAETLVPPDTILPLFPFFFRFSSPFSSLRSGNVPDWDRAVISAGAK